MDWLVGKELAPTVMENKSQDLQKWPTQESRRQGLKSGDAPGEGQGAEGHSPSPTSVFYSRLPRTGLDHPPWGG